MKRKLDFEDRESKRLNTNGDRVESTLREIREELAGLRTNLGISHFSNETPSMSNVELLSSVKVEHKNLLESIHALKEEQIRSQALIAIKKFSFVRYLSLRDLHEGENSRLLGKILKDSEAVQQDTTMEDASESEDLSMKIIFDLEKNLNSLEMRHEEIGANRAVAIAGSLKHQRVHKIGLRYNELGGQGVVAVAEAIALNHHIRFVDLRRNSMGDQGAFAVAEALARNPNIEELDLSSNGITDEGAVQLAIAFKTAPKLAHVDLYGNALSDQSSSALAEAISASTTLSAINLSKNLIGSDGAVNILQAVSKKKGVFSLDLAGNQITDEVKNEARRSFVKHIIRI